MANYDRLNFSEEWTKKVSQYLSENPEEGFEEDEVKEFIKLVTNKYMNGAIGMSEEEVLKRLKEIQEKN